MRKDFRSSRETWLSLCLVSPEQSETGSSDSALVDRATTALPAGRSCNFRGLAFMFRPQIGVSPHGYAVRHHVQKKTKRDRADGKTARQVCQEATAQIGEGRGRPGRRYGRTGWRSVVAAGRPGAAARLTFRTCGVAARDKRIENRLCKSGLPQEPRG